MLSNDLARSYILWKAHKHCMPYRKRGLLHLYGVLVCGPKIIMMARLNKHLGKPYIITYSMHVYMQPICRNDYKYFEIFFDAQIQTALGIQLKHLQGRHVRITKIALELSLAVHLSDNISEDEPQPFRGAYSSGIGISGYRALHICAGPLQRTRKGVMPNSHSSDPLGACATQCVQLTPSWQRQVCTREICKADT